MKQIGLLIGFLLMAITLPAQGLLEKKLDIRIKDQLLEKALLHLSQVAAVEITFSNDILPPNRQVNLSVRQKTLANILDLLLEDTRVEYKIIANRIVLVPREKPNQKYTVSGFIHDLETGEKLISSNIYVPGTNKGTTTNVYGFFSLTLPEGKNVLKVSYLGYQSIEIDLVLDKNEKIKINLTPSLTLAPVVVVAYDSLPTRPDLMSTDEIPLGRFETLPALGGEVDLIRLAHLLAGVQTGADGVGGIHIRGGGVDQNLILLDGVPVYNAAHMAGVFSIFNSSAVKSTRLIKGSFPSRYGGRLSSVLDVRTKEGNKRAFGAEATIGLTSAKLSIEGPLKKDTSSFILSARKSFLGAYVRPISRRSKKNKGQSGESDYDFYDLNGKVNFSVGSKDELFLSVYNGGDRYENETSTASFLDGAAYQDTSRQSLTWGNTIAALRWNHLLSSKLFVNTTLSYSRYYFKSDDLFTYRFEEDGFTISELTFSRFKSKIEDFIASVDLEYSPSSNHFLRFGAIVTRHSFEPGVAAIGADLKLTIPDLDLFIKQLDSLENPTINTLESAIYIEDDITFSRNFHANLGLRASMLNVQGESYHSLEPRVNLAYRLGSKWSLKGSFSIMKQYLHLLTTSGIGLPNDLWVPSTARVKPQTAWQVVGGFNYKLGDGLVLDVEAYYKKMNNVITFQEGSSISFIDAENWENSVTAGQGWSYGLETGISKNIGNTTGWLNYTLAWSERQFDDINLGEKYPFRYDRRHEVKLALVHRLTDHWNLSGNWVFGTGIAITLPISEYVFDIPSFIPTTAFNFGEKNSLRLPAYHRLDLGANYRFGRNKFKQEINFGIYNVTNAQNPLYYRLSRDPSEIRKRTYVQATLLPFVPYFSYNIRF